MMKYFLLVISVFSTFCSVSVSANGIDHFNPKHYVYDDEGNPLFIKVYLNDLLSQKEKTSGPIHKQKWQILNLMTRNDQIGRFLVIPLKNNSNDDEDTWECPYCGTINPATRNTCSKKSCPLHR